MLKAWVRSRKFWIAVIGALASTVALLLWRFLPLTMTWQEVLLLTNAALAPLYGWAGVEGVRDIVASLLQNAKALDFDKIRMMVEGQSKGQPVK